MNAAELTSYVSLAEEIIDKWSKSNPEYLARLLLPICGELTSARFNDDRQYELSRKYALIALENADQIPLNLEFELSGHVGNRRPIQDQNIFVERRKKNVSAWLHAWGRVENAIDPNWDPDEEIVVVMPTPGPEGFVGGDPKSIKDPKLRAQYERARLEKQKNIKHKTNQFRLRRWGQVILTHWEPNIVRAYSQPPYNMGELKQLLTEYQIGDEASNRIINAVKEQSQN
jgi:hypothetical protein